jgi:hypothetical protein
VPLIYDKRQKFDHMIHQKNTNNFSISNSAKCSFFPYNLKVCTIKKFTFVKKFAIVFVIFSQSHSSLIFEGKNCVSDKGVYLGRLLPCLAMMDETSQGILKWEVSLYH